MLYHMLEHIEKYIKINANNTRELKTRLQSVNIRHIIRPNNFSKINSTD